MTIYLTHYSFRLPQTNIINTFNKLAYFQRKEKFQLTSKEKKISSVKLIHFIWFMQYFMSFSVDEINLFNSYPCWSLTTFVYMVVSPNVNQSFYSHFRDRIKCNFYYFSREMFNKNSIFTHYAIIWPFFNILYTH